MVNALEPVPVAEAAGDERPISRTRPVKFSAKGRSRTGIPRSVYGPTAIARAERGVQVARAREHAIKLPGPQSFPSIYLLLYGSRGAVFSLKGRSLITEIKPAGYM